MYSILIGAERVALLAMLIIGCFAGIKAFRLIQLPSEKQLYHHADHLFQSSFSLAILAAFVAAINLIIAWAATPTNWTDRLMLRAPLAIFLLLAIWLAAMPRLRMLLKRTQAQREQSPDVARIRQATHPMLIVPYLFTTLAATVLFLFSLVPHHPMSSASVVTSISILILLGILLWIFQLRNHETALAAAAAAESSLADQALYYNSRLERLIK